MAYYLDKRAVPNAWKPYDRQTVRRDLHDARTASIKISAGVRRWRKRRKAAKS